MAFEYTQRLEVHDISVAPQAPYVFEKTESYNDKLRRIEIYVGVTSILLVFLVLFGSFRRRSHGSFLKYLIWTAYFLSTKLITYTLGQMQSSTYYNEMFAVWAVFLGVVLSNSDSISAYSLEDNEHQKRVNLEILVQSFWVGYLIGEYINKTELMIQLYVVWFLSLMRGEERVAALASASRSRGLAEHSKLVSDYMCHEHELSKDDLDVDPVCMKGYNYLVTGEKDEWVKYDPPFYRKTLDITVDEVITVHKIWECKGSLLSSRNDPRNLLKDICLSFALCRLLRRRLGGFVLHESSLDKTWNFVRYGLLSEDPDDDQERAFRVVEVELAFLYDSLYTKYPVIFAHGLPTLRSFVPILIVGMGSWIVGSFLIDYHTPYGYRNLTVGGFNCDVLLTYLVIFTFIFIEVVQLVLVYSSDWAKVIFVSKYVAKPSWRTKNMEKILGFVCHSLCLNSKPWERKLGQYSLIKYFDHDPSKLINNSFISPYMDVKRKGQKESKRINLTAEVKKAVILSLKTNERQLSNGLASLQRNGLVDQLSWACQLETQTHVLLVWHIATSLCEMSLSFSSSGKKIQSQDFKVANALSKYCAYLVAFQPRLLPDHAYTTEFIFDKVVTEARDVLKGCKNLESKYQKMMKLGHEGDHEREIIKKGAVLGRQLMDEIQDGEILWKVLAEFWAEMMLFVAPSNDVTAHAENLATGGEFVTHLWALLTHAGILKRSEQAVAPDV